MFGLNDDVKLIAARIGGSVWGITPFHGLDHASPSLVATFVYMAAHLPGSSFPLSRISQIAQASEDGVAQMYMRMYGKRVYVITQHMLPHMGTENDIERALARLPIHQACALAWEELGCGEMARKIILLNGCDGKQSSER